MEIKVPKNKWIPYTTIYKTPVTCSKCGQTTYLDLAQYSSEYTKKYTWAKNKDWAQEYCSLCGELLVAYMTESENEKTPKLTRKVGNVYRIKTKDERSIYSHIKYGYIDQYAPFSCSGDATTLYRVILLSDLNQKDGIIVHCGNFENCISYFDRMFEILEDTGVPNHYPDFFISEKMDIEGNNDFFLIGSNTWYDIKAKEKDPIDKEYPNAVAACIQQLGESDAYNLVLHLENGWNYVTIHCASLAICKEVLEENFHIFHISENQDIPLKSEKEEL